MNKKINELDEETGLRYEIDDEIRELREKLSKIPLDVKQLNLIQLVKTNANLLQKDICVLAGYTSLTPLNKGQPARDALDIENKIARLVALRNSIMTKTEALNILREIAVNSDKERTKIDAINSLSKLFGWEAPVRTINENQNITSIKFEEDKPIEEKSDGQ